MGKFSCFGNPTDVLLDLANENSWVRGDVSYLLRSGSIPKNVVMYALERACSRKNVEIVRELLDHVEVPSSFAVIQAAVPPFSDGGECFRLLESRFSDWRDLEEQAKPFGRRLLLVNLLIGKLRKKEVLKNLDRDVDVL